MDNTSAVVRAWPHPNSAAQRTVSVLALESALLCIVASRARALTRLRAECLLHLSQHDQLFCLRFVDAHHALAQLRMLQFGCGQQCAQSLLALGQRLLAHGLAARGAQGEQRGSGRHGHRRGHARRRAAAVVCRCCCIRCPGNVDGRGGLQTDSARASFVCGAVGRTGLVRCCSRVIPDAWNHDPLRLCAWRVRCGRVASPHSREAAAATGGGSRGESGGRRWACACDAGAPVSDGAMRAASITAVCTLGSCGVHTASRWECAVQCSAADAAAASGSARRSIRSTRQIGAAQRHRPWRTEQHAGRQGSTHGDKRTRGMRRETRQRVNRKDPRVRRKTRRRADLAAVPSPSVTAMHRSMRTRRSRADRQQIDDADAASVAAATAGAGAAPSAAADDRRRKRARSDTASASSSTAHSAAVTSLPAAPAPAPADDATPVALTVADGITVQVQPMKVSPRCNQPTRTAGTGAVLNQSSHSF